MELKDYVAETLKNIIEGVKATQQYAIENNARINPNHMNIENGIPMIFDDSRDVYHDRYGQMVEFDVVVTVSEGSQNKAAIGVFAGPVGIGTQGQIEGTNTAINRIKFSVPVFLPEQTENH